MIEFERLHYKKKTTVETATVTRESYTGVEYNNPCTDDTCELDHIINEVDDDDDD